MRVVRAALATVLLTSGLAACTPYEGEDTAYAYDANYAYGLGYFGGFGFFDDFDVDHRRRHHHHHDHDQVHDSDRDDHRRDFDHHLRSGAPPPSQRMIEQRQHQFTRPQPPQTFWQPRSQTLAH